MIVIEKDKHTTSKKPFWQAHLAYHEWFLSQDFNNEENTFISLGDLFHTAIPNPEEIDAMISLYERSKFKKIILLAGNHDFSDTTKCHSILPLRNNSRVELILEPCQKIIENQTFYFMPHYVRSENYPPMREFYENPSESIINNDFLLYHIEDETISFGKNKIGINLSKWKGRRIGGHVHKPMPNYELGMPVISRYDEKGTKNTLLTISNKKEVYLDVPKFIDYYDLEYGQPVPDKTESMFAIWDIINAPSIKEGRKLYPTLHIRKVHVANSKQKLVEKTNYSKRKSIKDYFDNYITNRTDFSKIAIDKLKSIIDKR